MPGLIVELEKKLQEDDPIVENDHDNDWDDSNEDDDTDDSGENDDSEDDDDKEDGAEELTKEERLAELRMEFANLQREFAEFRRKVADNFKRMLLMLEALVTQTSEILAQHSAGPSVSHEPGPTPASATVDIVASKPDSTSSAPAVDALPATTGYRAPAFLAPAATAFVVAFSSSDILPIEAGDTPMPDAAT